MAWLVVQLSSSPDLANCEFFFLIFLKPKLAVKGKRFHEVSTIQEQQGTLADFQGKSVTKCFQQSCKHWAYCVKTQGTTSKGTPCNSTSMKLALRKNTVEKLSDHTTLFTCLPEWRRTTMMHVVASSDPRIFTFSVNKISFLVFTSGKCSGCDPLGYDTM